MKNNKLLIGIVCGIILIIGLVWFGFESIASNSVITAHEDTDAYENTITMQESLDKTVSQETAVNSYMKGIHLRKNKEKVFFQFLENLEYYSKTFSYDNENKYNYTHECANPVYISASNKSLKQGKSYTIDNMEIMPVFKGDSPPNSPTFPNLKISKPNAPFLKLVYTPWFCDTKQSLFGSAYIATCNGPNFFVAVPNYKYLKDTYSKYLSKAWTEYFDIKIKQQEDLRNCAFSNGNGGRAPVYIEDKEIMEWTDALVKLITKYPDFIMVKKIEEQINDLNYPEYKKLLERLEKGTEIYDYIKNVDEDLAAEYE